MACFEMRECTDQNCRLRMPVDMVVYVGAFCPRCGAAMKSVEPEFTHKSLQKDPGTSTRQMTALLDNLRSAYNVGAIFRTADGAGLQHLYLCGITPSPGDNLEINKTALGAENSIPWTIFRNALDAAEELKRKGYLLIAMESTLQAVPIHDFVSCQQLNRPLALIMGNERAGVDPGLIRICDVVISLPMVGQKASLNVAVAFGIAVYMLKFL